MIALSMTLEAAISRKLLRFPAALQNDTLRTINRLTIRGRNELNRRLSASTRPDPFWGPQSPGGPALGVRSGRTRAKLGPGTVVVRGNVIQGTVGHPSRHVRFLEHGGTIRGHMQIPTAAALTAAGVPSERQIGRVFTITTRSGNRWRATTDRRRLVLLKLLKSSVKLESHPVFRDTKRALKPELIAAARAGVRLQLSVLR